MTTVQDYWSSEVNTWNIRPNNEVLKKYIHGYWLVNRGRGVKRKSHPKLHPDPYFYLVIADEKQPFSYTSESSRFTGYGSHWVYPHCETFTMDHSNGVINLGIKFKPGAMYSIPYCKDSWQINSIKQFDLSNILNNSINHIGDIIKQDSTNPYIYRNLVDGLIKNWIQEFKEDSHTNLVRKVLLKIDHVQISDLSEILGKSQRTIERSFQKVTGFNMKQFHSMRRLEKMLIFLHNLGDQRPEWACIASQFDFNDQSHLIRHMKNQMNITPSEYLRDRDLSIDIYGDFKYT